MFSLIFSVIVLVITIVDGQTTYYSPDYHWWGYGIEYEFEGIIHHILMHEPEPIPGPERIQYEVLVIGLIIGMILFGVYKAVTKKWAIVEYDENGVQRVKYVKKQPTILRPNEMESMIQVNCKEPDKSVSSTAIIQSLESEVEHFKKQAETTMQELLRDIIRKI